MFSLRTLTSHVAVDSAKDRKRSPQITLVRSMQVCNLNLYASKILQQSILILTLPIPVRRNWAEEAGGSHRTTGRHHDAGPALSMGPRQLLSGCRFECSCLAIFPSTRLTGSIWLHSTTGSLGSACPRCFFLSPMIRLTLEMAFEALENPHIPLSKIKGSDMGASLTPWTTAVICRERLGR